MIVLLLILLLVLIGGGIWAWPVLAGLLGLSTVHDKSGALSHIRQLMLNYEISPAEVASVFAAPVNDLGIEKKRSKGEIATTLFSYLGAILIFAGLATYTSTFWNSMGAAMRVIITLGVGYALFVLLVSALHQAKHVRLVMPLTLLSTAFMFAGWFVLIDEMFPSDDNWQLASLVACATLGAQWGALLANYNRTLFALLGLVFAYGFFQVGLDLLDLPPRFIAILLGASLLVVASGLEKTAHRLLCEPALLVGVICLNMGLFELLADQVSPNSAACVIGLCVWSTGFGLHKTGNYPRLSGLGYFFGSAMLYSGAFDLLQGSAVELLFLALTASGVYACVALQSRALLVTSVLAMLNYIGYFTAEHFADSLGWPITLVLMGAAFLAVGTLALRVRTRL